MHFVPDAIVQYILSKLHNAQDIAACTCVSKRWKESIPYIPSLYFPRCAFEGIPASAADATIGRMITSAIRLEQLVIYCPFSYSSLASWLSLKSLSLRYLELRMDSIVDKRRPITEADPNRLDCIEYAKGLESLKLWGASLIDSPNWSSFQKLHTLEIVGTTMRDDALRDTLRAMPNLTNFSLLGCEGLSSVVIESSRLQNCKLDILAPGDSLLSLSSPSLQVLDIQGFSWIRVDKNHHLRSVSISKTSGRVCKVDVGKLVGLDYLSLRGVQWCWSAVSAILECASDVKHLVMKIEFCGESDRLQPFPQIDLVEFFNSHPKLQVFHIHGAMFAALCQRKSLKSLNSRFMIPCLKEVIITVRSPLNAEQKLNTLESLVKYSAKLQKMVIRISHMKNCHESADDFFEEICRLRNIFNNVVRIE